MTSPFRRTSAKPPAIAEAAQEKPAPAIAEAAQEKPTPAVAEAAQEKPAPAIAEAGSIGPSSLWSGGASTPVTEQPEFAPIASQDDWHRRWTEDVYPVAPAPTEFAEPLPVVTEPFDHAAPQWEPESERAQEQDLSPQLPPPLPPIEMTPAPAQPTYSYRAPLEDNSTPQEGRLLALNMAKSFGGRKVLRDVSLSVDRGEVVGLLGPNGAGKTTSFYMVCGLLTPDAGQVSIDGKDITRKAVYQRARLGLGYLPQEASIFRGLSVEKNILAILETRYRNRRERREKLEALLDEFHIQHIRKSPALALSGGERRRVEIARALAADPSYVLLDEPFAGIDPIAVGDIRKLVSQLKNRGIGILITDHNVRETLGVVDRAYIIFDGQVLKHGRPEDVIDDQAVRDVYLGQQFAL